MSVIAAVEKDGKRALAWSGGFSTAELRNINRSGPSRTVSNGATCISVAGLSVYCNLLKDYTDKKGMPRFSDESSVFAFFLEFLRVLQSDYHFLRGDWDSESPTPFSDCASEFLVVCESGLFVVKEILSVSRYARYCVIGSGASHAEGALEALYESTMGCRELARTAVEIAMKFDPRSFGSVECREVGATEIGDSR